MKNYYFTTVQWLIIMAISLSSITSSYAQKQQAKAKVSTAKYFDKSFALRDITIIPPDGNHKRWKDGTVPNQLQRREYLNSANALPKNGDKALQRGFAKHEATLPLLNFEGIKSSDNSSSFTPPDTDGDVGPNYYFQMVNVMFEIFDKQGNSVYGPADNKTLWEGFVGEWTGTNDGDPIVLYDENANRWIATQFALPNYPSGPFYELVAISETDDPLGAWYRYAFEFSSMPDYPKFGIWNDGYYMSLNSSGDDAVVFERDSMIAGSENARMVSFKTPGMPGNGFKSALPACSQGSFPPEGTPNSFVYFNDDGWGSGEDAVLIWEFDVDWLTPDNSNMTLTQTLSVEPFDSEFDQNWNDIKQPGTSQKIDAVPGAIMYSLHYRNFGSYQAIVANHTVDVDATNHAGIRWYELRNYNDGAGWVVYQQSTFAPDSDSRFMGSIAMDGSGNIALGYSVSSTETYPSIRYTARLASDPLNQMTYTETELVTGTNSQTVGNRWGDYSMMSIDPVDDATFWYTQEFIGSGGRWATQIASFQLQEPITSFLSYSLENQFGFSTFDADAGEVYVTIKYGEPIDQLIASFELVELSVATVGDVVQESGVTVNDFTNDVIYTITHNDSVSEDWKIVISEQIPEKQILSYSIPEETRPAIIDQNNFTIDVQMPYGTNLTDLVANFSLSAGAIATVNEVIQDSSVTVNDFINEVEYIVEAMDGTTQTWKVKVLESSGLCEAGSDQCDEFISHVNIGDIDNASACDGYADYSYLTTNVKRGEVYEMEVTNGITTYSDDECGIWIDWDNNREFSAEEKITVNGTPGSGPYTAQITPPDSAADGLIYMRIRITYNSTPEPCGSSSYGEVEDYTLFVIGDDEAEMLSFNFEATLNASIDEDLLGVMTDSTIYVDAPVGADITSLVPSFILSNGATAFIDTVLQESELTANDYSDSIVYTIVSETGENTKQYIVKVDNSVSVYSNLVSTVRVFPNPANESLHVYGLQQSNVTLYNLLGVAVKSETMLTGNKVIGLSDLPQGTYLLHIETAEGLMVQKINVMH